MTTLKQALNELARTDTDAVVNDDNHVYLIPVDRNDPCYSAVRMTSADQQIPRGYVLMRDDELCCWMQRTTIQAFSVKTCKAKTLLSKLNGGE